MTTSSEATGFTAKGRRCVAFYNFLGAEEIVKKSSSSADGRFVHFGYVLASNRLEMAKWNKVATVSIDLSLVFS